MREPIKIILFTEVNSKLGSPFLRMLSAHPMVHLQAVVTTPVGHLCDYFVNDERQVDVASEAQAFGITVLRPINPSRPEMVETLETLCPDYFIVANYQRRLSEALLAVPRMAALNFHPSPLPRYAGLAPFYWMVRNGERQGAISVIKMDAGLDTGAVACQRPINIREQETGIGLRTLQEQHNVLMLLDLIPALADGSINYVPQDLGARSYFSRPIAIDYQLDLTQDAGSVLRHIRAAYRFPGAFHRLDNGVCLVVLSAQIQHEQSVLPQRKWPGQIIRTHDAVYLAAADGWLHLLTLEQDGLEIPALAYDLPEITQLPAQPVGLAIDPPFDQSEEDTMNAKNQVSGAPSARTDVRYSFISGDSAKKVWMSGDAYRIVLDAKHSANTMTLIEAMVPPGGGPPMHAHEALDELFFVQEGELQFTVDGLVRQVSAGDCVFVARTVAHAFFNPHSQPARMLLFYAPAGAEAFFLAAGVPAIEGEEPPPVDPVTRDREISIAGQHGIVQAHIDLAHFPSLTGMGER